MAVKYSAGFSKSNSSTLSMPVSYTHLDVYKRQALGTAATISELATALPYFAFMAILFNYQLSFIELTIILLLYNFIYTLPLIILFFVYIKAKSKFDKFYSFIKRYITKFSNILLPAVFGAVGILLLFHSISSLLH